MLSGIRDYQTVLLVGHAFRESSDLCSMLHNKSRKGDDIVFVWLQRPQGDDCSSDVR